MKPDILQLMRVYSVMIVWFCSEVQLLLQKLLLLHPNCPRLWIKLGEIRMGRRFKQRSFESTAASSVKHDRCKHKTDIISSNNSFSAKGQDFLFSGLADASSSAVSDDTAVDADCNAVLSNGDGPTPEVNIPSDVILSLTCFVAAE